MNCAMYSGRGVGGGGGVGLRGGGVGVLGGGGGLYTQLVIASLKLRRLTNVGGFFGGAFGAINFSIFGGVLTYVK